METSDPDYNKAKEEAKVLLKSIILEAPPVDVDSIIASKGLTIRQVDFNNYNNDIAKGVAGVLHLKGKSIYINIRDSRERQNFTKAHELGHWILHKEFFEENPSKQVILRRENKNDTKEEKEANSFAAVLLIPAWLLKTTLMRFPSASMANLAKMFQVSLSFMAYRIKNIVDYKEI